MTTAGAGRLIIAIGGTAARSLLGRAVTVAQERGRSLTLPDGGEGWVTVHPSYLLRRCDRQEAERQFSLFVQDLRAAASRVGEGWVA